VAGAAANVRDEQPAAALAHFGRRAGHRVILRRSMFRTSSGIADRQVG